MRNCQKHSTNGFEKANEQKRHRTYPIILVNSLETENQFETEINNKV